METWMIVSLIVIADLAIGIKFAVPKYVKKLDELERELQKSRPDERYLEFPFWKELGWNLAVFVFWWFIFPYEWKTGWRQWTYPYCRPGGAPKGWDKPIVIRPQADVIAALKISGKTVVKEVNQRVNKLENATKVSPKFLRQKIMA